MKRFSNLFVALGVTLFLLTVGMKSEAEATCPLGFTSYIDTISVGGCDYIVDMCVECTVTRPGRVTINTITPLDTSCLSMLTPDQKINQVLSHISNWAYVWFDACSKVVPPCNESSKRITFDYPLCWAVEWDSINARYWYSSCDFSVCSITYDYCMLMPEMIVQRTVVGHSQTGIPSCTLEGHQVDLPDEFNPVTECFILHTVCNP